ncbi:DUF4328 domain-containing protein [Chryseobacterium suipulveris]|uniref:DUF4328 domain-containing protein n=1 Tax=Chryseobacterium suipulveris TaxID=2929800 RepID=UPI0021D5BCD9|nr:DUF4328 domain-containing protein [Chryseobacterium suipulveris]
MKNLRPNEQRAKNAIILIWIILGLEIISLISGFSQYSLLQSAVNGSEISEAAADSNDNRESLIGIVFILTCIVSVVTFIMWFRRAYFNLHQMIRNLSHDESWAAGSWFVPILNLFRHVSIMKEMYVRPKEFLTAEE